MKDRRTVAEKQLQAIIEAWDAWNPDDMSALEKWIDGCSRLEKAIDSARAEIGGGK